MKIRLDHRAHGAEFAVQIADQAQGTVGVLARLHVHAHEAPDLRRLAHHLVDICAAGCCGEIHAELGQLERDVAVDGRGVHFAERAQVGVPRSLGLGQRGDVLAQMIERKGDALGIDFTADGKRFGKSFTGDEPARETLGNARSLHPPPQARLVGEEQKQSPHLSN